jgi:hypothetical protein
MFVSVSVVTAALLVLPAVASASVKYADYRQTSDSSIFVKHDSNGDGDWHHVTSGGYVDSDTDWPCHVTHGWSWTSGYDRDEWATWNLHGVNAFWYGEFQAYITTSGTNPGASYMTYGSELIFNQYTHHGWCKLCGSGYYDQTAYLDDADWVYGTTNTQTDWDAIRIYY